MTLLENSYDSINESLRKTIEAESNPSSRKFALLTIVQAIELLLKECLYREHRLLVYENVDKPTRTVTLGLAFERLNKLGVGLARSEVANVKRAMDLRNDIQHYEFEKVVTEARNHYSRLFEFATAFHHDHLRGELHPRIDPSLWDREAELIELFNREFVPYQGQSVIREWPARIRAAQTITRVTLAVGTYERLKYGEEPSLLSDDPTFAKYPCHGCAALAGQYHVPDCDVEMCPRCGGQFITCDCELAEPDADDLED